MSLQLTHKQHAQLGCRLEAVNNQPYTSLIIIFSERLCTRNLIQMCFFVGNRLSQIQNLLITSETVIILPVISAFTRFQTAKGDLVEIAFCCCE